MRASADGPGKREVPMDGEETSLQQSILIADEDPDTRDSLREILTGEGYAVVVVATGVEVLALLQTGERPTVVFLDESLRDMRSAEILAHAGTHGIPVVMLSAELDPISHPLAAAVLRKPFNLDQLLDLARRYQPQG